MNHYAAYIYAHQDLFASCHTVAMSLFNVTVCFTCAVLFASSSDFGNSLAVVYRCLLYLFACRSVMDEWGNDLRARVSTGCEVRCSRGVVWRGALELQEQSEARAAHTAFGSNRGALRGGTFTSN